MVPNVESQRFSETDPIMRHGFGVRHDNIPLPRLHLDFREKE